MRGKPRVEGEVEKAELDVRPDERGCDQDDGTKPPRVGACARWIGWVVALGRGVARVELLHHVNVREVHHHALLVHRTPLVKIEPADVQAFIAREAEWVARGRCDWDSAGRARRAAHLLFDNAERLR